MSDTEPLVIYNAIHFFDYIRISKLKKKLFKIFFFLGGGGGGEGWRDWGDGSDEESAYLFLLRSTGPNE